MEHSELLLADPEVMLLFKKKTAENLPQLLDDNAIKELIFNKLRSTDATFRKTVHSKAALIGASLYRFGCGKDEESPAQKDEPVKIPPEIKRRRNIVNDERRVRNQKLCAEILVALKTGPMGISSMMKEENIKKLKRDASAVRDQVMNLEQWGSLRRTKTSTRSHVMWELA